MRQTSNKLPWRCANPSVRATLCKHGVRNNKNPRNDKNKKGDRIMEYKKPVINLVADAVDVIQGSKIGGVSDNPPQMTHTTAAYEADE
jgi:hypothetical protein